MSLRILHVLDHSAPLHSGYAFRTLSILSEQRRLGWETIHLTSPKQGATGSQKDEVDGWVFFRTPNDGQAGFMKQIRLTAGRLAEVVQAEKPDLIHAHSPVLNALPALWVGRRYRVPVVYEMRASWEDAAVDHGTTTEGSLRYRASRAIESFALRRVDHITTICEGLRGDIAVRGIPADRITVIPNAVDVSAFNFNAVPDSALRAQLGLDGATVLGFVGSFYGYEGLNLLLEALPDLLQHHRDLRVLLVGGGPREADLKQQAQALGVAERVIFVGRVPHKDVQRYYDLVDVLAYPRLPMRLTELVTPLKPLEAMAQGRLFVASDVGGHRELVRDGETGFLFKAGSSAALGAAVNRLLQRRAEWPRVREQARRFVEVERSWTGSVARYREVYRLALAARGHAVAALGR